MKVNKWSKIDSVEPRETVELGDNSLWFSTSDAFIWSIVNIKNIDLTCSVSNKSCPISTDRVRLKSVKEKHFSAAAFQSAVQHHVQWTAPIKGRFGGSHWNVEICTRLLHLSQTHKHFLTWSRPSDYAGDEKS